MRTRILALSLVWAATLCGQHRRFSWQEACFKNPAAPFCAGNDFAIKHQGLTKDTVSHSVDMGPFPSTPEVVTPSVIVVGGIDWRFADPSADALFGFNLSGLATAPLARNLIAQFGANQGLTEADIKKVFDNLAGLDLVGLSVHGNQTLVMATGRVTDSTLPPLETGMKAVPVSGNALLIGPADAVDQAVQRIAQQGPLDELSRLAGEQQANSEFCEIAAAALVGPQAVSAGMKRFSLSVSIRNHFTSDLAFVFDGVPGADTVGMLQTTLGPATLQGNVVHIRASMEADEVQQKFGKIAASPVGQPLAALLEAARYLPVHDAARTQTKPVIYGLDSGPKELRQ